MKNDFSGQERRRFSRSQPESGEKYSFTAYSMKDQPEQVSGELLNYSEQGVGVRLTSALSVPKRGAYLHAVTYQIPDGKTVTKEIGVVKTVDTRLDEAGKSYVRIGLQFVSIAAEGGSAANGMDFPVRPTRYNVDPSCINQTEVAFQLNDENLAGRLLNFSKFGVAIRIDREAPLQILPGNLLHPCKILLNQKIVFEGRMAVRNIRQQPQSLILGCQTLDSLLDSHAIQDLTKTFLASENVKLNLFRFFESTRISEPFKAAVADYRHYMEYVQGAIDTRNMSPSVLENTVKEIYPLFKMHMDNIYEGLKRQVENLPSSLFETYQGYLQRQILPLFTSAPFFRHAYRKPYGYAGDYEMVLKILDKEMEGESLLSKLVNIYGWNIGVAVAHRNRIDFLVEKIEYIVKRNVTAKILSIGCGPAREVKRFLEAHTQTYPCSFTLVDFDPRALTCCQENLLPFIVGQQARVKIKFINKSVRQIIKSKRCDLDFEKYDLVICAGLFDYLSDSFCQKLLEIMASQLSERGVLSVTNVTPYNYHRYMMDHVVEWYLTHRGEDDMMSLAQPLIANHGVELSTQLDETKVNVFLNAQKRQNIRSGIGF